MEDGIPISTAQEVFDIPMLRLYSWIKKGLIQGEDRWVLNKQKQWTKRWHVSIKEVYKYLERCPDK